MLKILLAVSLLLVFLLGAGAAFAGDPRLVTTIVSKAIGETPDCRSISPFTR